MEIRIDRSGYRLDIPDDEPIDDLVAAGCTLLAFALARHAG